jgi:subtilase family serine protease
MARIWLPALLGAGAVLGAVSIASARVIVEQSDGVYHVAVCPGPAAPRTPRCFAHVLTDSKGAIIATRASPNTTPKGYAPADLDAAYNITTAGKKTTVIALIDAYGYTNAEADLAVYRAQFGLPPCTSANKCFAKYNQEGKQGNYPAQDIGWAEESALDLDMASAMCPNCRLILVEAKTNTFRNLAAAVDTAASLGAHVISNSYGAAEEGTQNFEPSYNHPGVAVTASAAGGRYGTSFPAGSPHVTAVGGTHLVRSQTARGWTETVYPGTGSGCSTLYAKPAWQTDPSCPMRMENDVAAVADPATGVAVYGPDQSGSSGWEVFGGTSVGAPLIAGVYGNNGGAVHYGADPYSHAANLHDITKGSNGTCPFPYWCHAEVGYDGPTGMGTPKGNAAF